MSTYKAVGNSSRVYSSPVKRHGVATPIWANDHLDVITERELRLTRGSYFTTRRLGRHLRVVSRDARVTHKIDKHTWVVVAEDGAFWYFGTFKQCQAMLDKIEMHQAKWFMVQGTMAEGFV